MVIFDMFFNIRENKIIPSTINYQFILNNIQLPLSGGRRGRDRMVVGFTTTYAISAYHH